LDLQHLKGDTGGGDSVSADNFDFLAHQLIKGTSVHILVQLLGQGVLGDAVETQLPLLGGGGLAAFSALGNGVGGEATLAILNDHLVTEDGPLGRAAHSLVRHELLLELGKQRSDVADAEDILGFLLEARLLDTAKLREIARRDIALAASGGLELPGNVQEIAGNDAFTGSGKIGHLVAGLGATETTQTATVDGRAQNDDFITVAENADHVAHGRVDFNEVVGGLLDDSQDFVLSVLQDVGSGADGNIHTVNLNLLLGREDLNLLTVQQDGDDFLVVLFAGENGELVTVGAILGENLVTAREGGIVEEAIEGSDGLGADQADTRGSQDGAGHSHTLRQEDFSDRVDLDTVVESVGVGFVELEVESTAQRPVDGLDGDLVGRIVDIHLVVGHVRSPEVTQEVGSLNGDVLDESGHLGVLE